jgi:outer membrane protein TolC
LLASPKGFADQNITLMAPIFTGGRLESALKAAMAQSMAADESLKATMLASESDAAQAYLIAVLQSSLVEVAQGRVTAEEAQVAAAKEKVTEGKLAPVDLLREQTELAQANQALIEARNSAALALVDMKQALGISQLSAVTILNSVETLPALPAPQATLEQALSHAAANRADLRAASRMNDAAADQIRSTHSEYSPQVYGVVMADATAQSGEFREGYTIGIAASIPLYDSGSRKADEAAAAAKALRAHADAAQAQLSIEQSVAAAWLNLQTAKSKLDVAQAGLGAAGESSRLADLRYTGGKSTVAERLDAFAALIRARGDMAQAKVGVTIAQVRLLAAVGDRPESLN